MRVFLLMLALLCTTGCGLQQMNSNMERTNELMETNTQSMQSANAAIKENTHQVTRSTDTMQSFGSVLPIGLIVILVVITIPAFILFKAYRKLLQDLKHLLAVMKRKK